MPVPSQPVTLSPEQLEELDKKLITMRHDINGSLALVVAALDIIRIQPAKLERMLATLAQQTPKITESLAKFSAEWDKTFGITRP